jgi:hypothetical protein
LVRFTSTETKVEKIYFYEIFKTKIHEKVQ